MIRSGLSMPSLSQGEMTTAQAQTDVPHYRFGSTAFQTTAKGLLLFELKSWIGRTFVKARPTRNPYIQIGSGLNVKNNFENLDFYVFKGARGVVGHDLRYPLPYPDETFKGAYSEHFLEHMYPNQAMRLLREIHRVLKPVAVFRCAVPDLQKYIDYYVGKPVDPEFTKFRSGCEAIWSLTQNWGHVSVWDASMLMARLHDVGFVEVQQRSYREGRNPELLIDQPERRWETLYVEAVR
jgi:predicted SAM-dependent methyltransferase